jgi:hypothetical protein
MTFWELRLQVLRLATALGALGVQKGEREIFTVKLGERIGDYKVANISSDRITLEAEADRFEVLLYDSRTPKKRVEVKTETKPEEPSTKEETETEPPKD